MTNTFDVWLPTKEAALALGRSVTYLKRQRITHGGWMRPGVHYCLAPSRTAPITWNVDLIRHDLNKRGMSYRLEEA